MTALSAFRDHVRRTIPNAPGPVIDAEVRFAAIDFCRRARVWRYALSPVTVVADTAEYTLTPPAGALIEDLFFAAYAGTRITPTNQIESDDASESWRSATADSATQWMLMDRNKLRIKPIPTGATAADLDLVVHLKPTQTATTVPDLLYNDYLEQMGWGVLARMYLQPGKPWFDPKLAGVYVQLFNDAVNKARSERQNDFTRTSTLRVRSHNYFGS